MIGVAIGSMFAFPSWVGASIGGYLLQEKLQKSIRIGNYIICLVVSLIFLYYLLFG
jgi:uncharacterized membrane protein YfcA